MNKIPREVYSYLSSIQGVRFEDQWAIFETKKGLYYYFPHPQETDVYDYFLKIGFTQYQRPINSKEDSFQLFFVESEALSSPLSILGNLYQKSSSEVMIDSLFVSRIEKKIEDSYQRVLSYYYGLQDMIEEMYYPRAPYYYLLVHISSVYRLLHLGKYYLDEWKKIREDVYREVLTIRNLSLRNFDSGLLDVSSSKKDFYVFEIANYYMNHYQEKDILEEICTFMKSFSMSKSDIYLLFSLISIVWEMDEENIEDVLSFLLYVDKTNSLLLDKYQEDEKSKEKMFKEEKENI